LTAPEELGFLTVSAGKVFLSENVDALNHDDMKDKLEEVLSFLWAVCKEKIASHSLRSLLKERNSFLVESHP